MVTYLDTLAILSVFSDKAKHSNDLQRVSSIYELVQLAWFSVSVFPCFKLQQQETVYSKRFLRVIAEGKNPQKLGELKTK